MRIAFLGAADSPHVIKWVNVLSEKGHDIVLYSMPNQQDKLQEITDKASVIYLPYAEAAGGLKKNIPVIRKAMQDESFRVAAAFDLLTYGFMAAKAKVDHLLLVSTGLDVTNGLRAGKKRILIRAIKGAVAVAATAPNVITRIKEFYKKDCEYFVTPFGVNMETFRKFDVPRSEAFTFGSLKRLEYYNHVEYVLEAFAKFRQKCGVQSLLRVVGSGDLLDELEAKAASLGIKDNVEFLGYVRNADMPKVINTLDVAVQMPDDECLGISGIEAMACEVPVVSSDTNGASEYILNGVTGYLVKVGNVERCSDCMVDLYNSPKQRETMGFQGREDVKEKYNLPKCVAEFEEALQAASGSRVN